MDKASASKKNSVPEFRRILPAPPVDLASSGSISEISSQVEATNSSGKKKYTTWDAYSESMLLDWLEENDGGNYARWLSSTVTNSSGRRNTKSDTKVSMSQEIVQYFAHRGVVGFNEGPVRSKIFKLEYTFKKAVQFLQQTGGSLMNLDMYLGIEKNRAKILGICEHWDRLYPLMGERVADGSAGSKIQLTKTRAKKNEDGFAALIQLDKRAVAEVELNKRAELGKIFENKRAEVEYKKIGLEETRMKLDHEYRMRELSVKEMELKYKMEKMRRSKKRLPPCDD